MLTIITPHTFDAFVRQYKEVDSIVLPVFADVVRHPCYNYLSALYIYFLSNRDDVIVPFSHVDAINLPIDYIRNIITNRNVFTFDKKATRHVFPNTLLHDVNTLQYIDTGIPLEYPDVDTPAHNLLSRNFGNRRFLNRFIPIVKHAESCKVLSSLLMENIESFRSNITKPQYTFINDGSSVVFGEIEESGIAVDPNLLKQFYGADSSVHVTQDDRVFSEYNLYTATGRPSNRFGGINYAALNKYTGARTSLISRFGDDGMLIQFDYDAYHFRLIADLIGFTLPPGNLHEHLAKYYFDTDTVTEDQYSESKRISFKILYGGIPTEYMSVPFFQQVDAYINTLWMSYSRLGYTQSPISGRRIYRKNMSYIKPQKLFNYLIQLYETENNVMRLRDVLRALRAKRTKVVLYTYDSILLDFHRDDGIDLITWIRTVFEDDGRYPTKVFGGKNYHSLINITNRF